VLLLFLVLYQMTNGPNRTGNLWRSALVAALFAIHPQHVESVAWISERKDVLSGIFFMLTLAAYLHYVRKPSVARYVTMSILFAAGLMSKPMLVTVPFVLLLLDYWPLRRQLSPTKLVIEKLPLVALSAASSLVTFLIQKHAGAQSDPLPFVWRIENAVVTYITYIWQMVWPANLAPLYPHPENSLPVWEIVLALVLLIAVTLIAILRRRTNPYLLTGWFWYLIMLLPVIGIVQVGAQGWADRYTYLPHIGLYLLITWGIADLAARWRYRRQILGAVVAIVLIALAWCSSIQASYWRNSESLWTHTLAVTSNNEVAYNNLGDLFFKRDQIDDALSHYEKALEIRSHRHVSRYDFLLALFHNNVASALRRKGLADEAIVHCQQAIQFQPDYPTAYINLGGALMERGRVDDAVAAFQTAVKIGPDDAETHINLANALRRQGLEEEAVAQYESALQITPQSISVLNDLAWLIATSPNPSIRNGSKAVALAEQAVRLSGGANPFFLHKLAAAHAENGDFPKALKVAERALQLATYQGQTALVLEMQRNIKLYRANTPLRSSGSPNATPAP
jgi:tetratricopeptide (TPR) repeat protein